MSTPAADARRPAFAVSLSAHDDFTAWRDEARRLVQAGVRPDEVQWIEPGGARSLFEGAAEAPAPAADAPRVRASKPFIELAQDAILHRDPDRFALLYRLLWRLQADVGLVEDLADRDVRRVDEMARSVRRDVHKMRAFVRFRAIDEPDGGERFVAWFEPEHHILRHTAGFFVRRFANMRWSILTPQGALHWDGETLLEGPPAHRSDAPAGDPAEALWRTYYASIFNPARLKVGAMLKEMPRKYWKNMPETALIPELVAEAQARENAMVEAGAIDYGERPKSLSGIDAAIHACRRCPIGFLDNTAVMGKGPKSAALMIVGEQPGDQEDLAGRPFVGPAGRVLDAHLERAGIDRRQVYLTNAVKHFKFVQRGKRRLHQSPTAKEIDVCRWWLEGERAVVQPRLVLALGASAARGLLGRTVSIASTRGRPHALEDGSELWVTVHPSYLLRLRDEAKDEQERLFQADLAAVAERLADLARHPGG
ncbi:MAG TPA: UdgX family uracil-DNA binding protein [Croceibacterium sp.]|nr:UdgX family uracil-DNA binding protein [Croceibacterium sp.]